MAERRMFSARITTNSARFLRLPVTAQCLYFHMGMQADDEGVVEAFITMRQVGASEEDLKVLEEKGFIKILNEDFVSYITDWDESNKIRSDRAQQSIHHDLLVQYLNNKSTADCPQVDNHVSADGQQSDNTPQTQQNSLSADCQQVVSELSADCPQVDNHVSADCQQSAAKCPHRIGEDSIGKESIGEYTSSSVSSTNSEYTRQPVDKLTTLSTPPNDFVEKIKQEQFGKVMKLYQDCIHPIPNQVEADDLCSLYDEFGAEWVTEAIKASARNRARTIAYVKAVLDKWANSGLNEPWKQSKPPGNTVNAKSRGTMSRSEQVAAMAREAAEMIAMGG